MPRRQGGDVEHRTGVGSREQAAVDAPPVGTRSVVVLVFGPPFARPGRVGHAVQSAAHSRVAPVPFDWFRAWKCPVRRLRAHECPDTGPSEADYGACTVARHCPGSIAGAEYGRTESRSRGSSRPAIPCPRGRNTRVAGCSVSRPAARRAPGSRQSNNRRGPTSSRFRRCRRSDRPGSRRVWQLPVAPVTKRRPSPRRPPLAPRRKRCELDLFDSPCLECSSAPSPVHCLSRRSDLRKSSVNR